jgi:hypothetical protein
MSGQNRLLDFKLSRFPTALGFCQADTVSAAHYVNSATQRLLYAPESNDSGFWGAWAEMAFTVSRTDPYLTTGRNVARLESINVCSYPIPVNNQFFEYLRFGFGRLPKNTCNSNDCINGIAAYERGTFPSVSDLVPPNKIIRVYIGDASDANKRTLIQGKDNNDQTIYSIDNAVQVEGQFLTLTAPFVDMPFEMVKLTGIQKDITNAPVRYFEVDTVTADSRLIATLEPTETVSSYRRYYLNNLPTNCCSDLTATTVQLTAIAKLDFIPVKGDTDYLLVSNIEALGNECQSIRYSETDSGNGKGMADYHHKQAIRLLNGELIHREGKTSPATFFAPFGTAKLSYLGFGQMR